MVDNGDSADDVEQVTGADEEEEKSTSRDSLVSSSGIFPASSLLSAFLVLCRS